MELYINVDKLPTLKNASLSKWRKVNLMANLYK